MSAVIKLSAPAKREFWEIPVLFEDAHLLALDKPSDLLISPDRLQPERSSLVQLLHDAIAAGKPWTVERGMTYLSPAHRLDAEASGILLLAKSKAMLIQLANLFGTGQPKQQFLALVQGCPTEAQFQINARLAKKSDQSHALRVDPRNGKRMETRFTVLERFAQHALVRCERP